MKKRILSFVIAIVLILVLVPTALAVDEGDITPLSHPFTDVGDTWYRPYVQFVFDNNIMTGTSATTFAPDSPFSRAMVVATLFRDYHGRRANDNDPRNHPFTDVGDTWYAPYVTWVYNNGIAGGVGGGRFAPHDAVTRQQFATFLFRYADRMTDFDTTVRTGPQWNNFTDRDQIESWALDALTWANYHGFVGGTSATTINPTGTANRAQAAAMITRYVRAANEPVVERVNIRDMVGGPPLSTVRHLFGNVISLEGGTEAGHISRIERFDTGLAVFAASRSFGAWTVPDLHPYDYTIYNIGIDYTFPGSGRFHFDGIDNRSTRADVESLLGEPFVDVFAASGEFPWLFTRGGVRAQQFLLDGTESTFIYDANDRVIEIAANRRVSP